MKNIVEVFKSVEDEYLQFERVKNKLCSRRDTHAFLLLDSLVKSEKGENMLAYAYYDEVVLGISLSELAASNVTVDQIRDLVRCGVRIDEGEDSLKMFV